MELSGVLFDLDGTLVDTERESAEAMARALLSGQDIVCTQEQRDFIIGRSWVDIVEFLRAGHPTLSWGLDELIAATAAEREVIFAEQGITIMPGALDAVTRFSALPRAIVTGSSRVEADQAITALGVRDAFGAVFAAEDVPTSKPDPAGYLMAAEALRVDPRSCLVLEDSTAGIAAGLAAGATVIAVRAGNFADQDQSAAHKIIDSLDELTHELIASI